MARALYQAVISLRDPITDALEALSNVRVTVTLTAGGAAIIFQAPTGSTQGPRPGSSASGGPNPFTTGDSGAIEFYADAPESYTITIEDLTGPARIATQSYVWTAWSTEDNSLPGSKLVDGSVVSDKLTSVQGAKLVDGTVGGAKLTSASVNGDRLIDASVASAKMVSVAGAKLVDGSVGGTKLTDNSVDGVKITDGTITLAKLATALQQALIPAGTILETGRTTAPVGFLLCDGTEISRTGTQAGQTVSNAGLFSAIGTNYGAGNGTTTFKLPDLRGRVAVGADGAAGILDALDVIGNSGGVQKQTLAIPDLPIHNHTGLTLAADRSLDHIHTFGGWAVPAAAVFGFTFVDNGSGTRVNSLAQAAGGLAPSIPNTAGVASSIDHLHGISNQGSGVAHNNMQPYQIVNHMIKL